MVSLLKAQRATQAEERLRAGQLWTDSGLVFTDEFGAPVNPRAVLRAVQRSADRTGPGSGASPCTPFGIRPRWRG
jgi:hypothetical protein